MCGSDIGEGGKMTYRKILLLGIAVLLASGLLLLFNFGSSTVLGSIGRVVGGLLLFPTVILLFDGVAKGRTLYILSHRNGIKKAAFWHKDI